MTEEPKVADELRLTPRRRARRLAFEIGVTVVAIAVVLSVSRGLSSVAPGLTAVLRVILHPMTLVLAAVAGIVLRTRAHQPKTSPSRGHRSSP